MHGARRAPVMRLHMVAKRPAVAACARLAAVKVGRGLCMGPSGLALHMGSLSRTLVSVTYFARVEVCGRPLQPCPLQRALQLHASHA